MLFMKAKNKQQNFTKLDLVEHLADKHRLTKTMADLAVQSVINSIVSALKKGHRVEIRDFGVFEVRKYGAYKGRNPQTGKTIQVKPKKLPFFKPGKFKKKVNFSRFRYK